MPHTSCVQPESHHPLALSLKTTTFISKYIPDNEITTTDPSQANKITLPDETGTVVTTGTTTQVITTAITVFRGIMRTTVCDTIWDPRKLVMIKLTQAGVKSVT